MRISDWSSDVCSSDLIQESDAARSSNLFLASGGGSASASTAEQPAPPAVQAIIPPGAEAPARPFLRADGPRRTDSGERIVPLASPYVVQAGKDRKSTRLNSSH